ncbi:hypothetical protein BT63DRAFT_427343 [Microthyrium microscopicum]|uniref:Calmodulin n=1 Tax=Microthyrium microscopicum TaxID=703497 RepID=A0A6A6U7I7_9PEZI|nr:hypothetical protein BT63DRAFT_427343 [Microthyrium microscopicum]
MPRTAKPKPKASTTKAPTARKPRLTKLAKEHSITNEQEAEISDAFALFATSSDSDATNGTLPTTHLQKSLVALNISIPRAELTELRATLDPDEEGEISYTHFLAYAALRLNEAADDADQEQKAEEVREAYGLFTRGGEGPITIAHLRRVAGLVKEEVDDATLKDMIAEANGKGWKDGVNAREFETMLRRAGVFT